MLREIHVSDAVVRRLPGYYRELKELEQLGVWRISSQQMGERMGLTASQIRQDMNCFGGFGQQGYGYEVIKLRTKIGEIIGAKCDRKMIIVGVGSLGNALANYPGFAEEGFVIADLFDADAQIIDTKVAGMVVRDAASIEAYLQEQSIDIAVIATPSRAAQGLAERLVRGGIKAIWNFAPIDVQVEVAVLNVHLSDSLFVLSYRMMELLSKQNKN